MGEPTYSHFNGIITIPDNGPTTDYPKGEWIISTNPNADDDSHVVHLVPPGDYREVDDNGEAEGDDNGEAEGDKKVFVNTIGDFSSEITGATTGPELKDVFTKYSKHLSLHMVSLEEIRKSTCEAMKRLGALYDQEVAKAFDNFIRMYKKRIKFVREHYIEHNAIDIVPCLRLELKNSPAEYRLYNTQCLYYKGLLVIETWNYCLLEEKK